MKRLLSVLSVVFLLLITFSSCHDPDILVEESEIGGSIETRAGGANATHYYCYKGEKIGLVQNYEYVNIVADADFLESSSPLLKKLDIESDGSIISLADSEQTNTDSKQAKTDSKQAKTDSKQTLSIIKLKIPSKSALSEFSTLIDGLKQEAQNIRVLPYFDRDDADPIGTSDIFYVKLKDGDGVSVLAEMADEQKVSIVKEVPYMPSWYILSIQNSNFSSSEDASNYFYESGSFEDVDPAFMFDFKPNLVPNDPMLSQQWGLKNDSYSGIDINATKAWDISRGVGATIAILDRGIDPNHNDLMSNFHSLSFDSQTGTPGSVFVAEYTHGTHVAGIAAAVMNNSLQIAGVAPGAKIMRVSNDLYIRSTISAELASGISWAWQNGAHVINNSWGDQGGSYYNIMKSTILETALTNAMTRGRNGLGCVVVFAAGNRAPVMDYPTNFSDDILTVGSIDSNGSRSWFSGYGTKLDVVAPGNNILSTLPNNSTGSMSGTSMAAPHVAGVAALVISANPTYTRLQVVNAIESTAKKIGGYSYATTSGRPNGTWNNQMGYGLVDAYAALNSGSCVQNITNMTYTTNTTISGCQINATDVTVASNATLTLSSSHIVLNPSFTVQSGSSLILTH